MINGDTLNPQVKDIVTEWTVMKGTKIGRSYYHCSTGHLTLSLRNSFVFLTVPINRQVLFYINIFLTSLKLISTMRSNCYFEFPTYFITRLHFVEYLFSSEEEFFFSNRFIGAFPLIKARKFDFASRQRYEIHLRAIKFDTEFSTTFIALSWLIVRQRKAQRHFLRRFNADARIVPRHLQNC